MALQIWSDNETDQDLLGFRVHADLIRSVVTDESILPIVLGVFGDWGGGKSSIMRMLQKDLTGEAYQNTVCLYFNGWMFEGYEDAKTALLSSILIQLGENEKFGPHVKAKVVSLLKRVKWMEVAKLGIKHVAVPLAAALMTGGIGGVATAVVSAAGTVATKLGGPGDSKAEDNGEDKAVPTQWSDLIEADPGKPDLLEVRKFRDDFSEMLAKTTIESLVIIIDDLDRCLPERIIETLEAIKLFVAVPKTAFVIGADPRIVRHAIATRYVKHQLGDDAAGAEDRYDLVKDYLEKLIQVPYHLPRLSPSEIETYMNLLACQNVLGSLECNKVLDHWKACRKKNLYAPYQQPAICEALGTPEAAPPELIERLSWSNAIADVVTDGLKGNPRQVKRMLNAMALRKQLASVAEIAIRDDVLAKLMVLEYANLSLFQQLSQWQGADDGFPEKLKQLEDLAIDGEVTKKMPDDVLGEWSKPAAQNWLRMQPRLSEIDLRDYFWLARDRTSSTLRGVAMVAPIVRRLFESLVSDNKGEQKLAVRGAGELAEGECNELLAMLRRQIERHPEHLPFYDALLMLAESDVLSAGTSFVAAVENAPIKQLAPGIAYKLQMLVTRPGEHQKAARALLESLAKDTESLVGRAAAKQLK